MSIPSYAPKETYIGTGSLDEYTFDFKINSLTHLLVIEVDDDGVETQRVRGDDNTYLNSVDYDAVNGGGTVTLAANLPANYSLILLLANDEPTQDYEFRNKASFSLRRFEDALDAILGAVQRLVYKTNQSVRIHDLDDEETFDPQLPPGIADQSGKVFNINSDGSGLEFGPTVTEIANAQAYAEIAQEAAATAGFLLGEHKNANFTAEYAVNKLYLVTGTVSIQLPEPELDRVIRFKKTGSSTITVLRFAGENIDGVAANKTFTSTKQSVTLYTDGVDWFII